MDKSDRQINQKSLIPPPRSSDNYSNFKTPHPVAKTKNNKENNESNIIDYKNISLAMTGKLLSQSLKFESFLLSNISCETRISFLYRRNKFRLYTQEQFNAKAA